MKIKEYFLPDNIKPLSLKENWLRYLSMILLAAGYYIFNTNYSLWFNFDMMNETVTFLGIIIEKTYFFIADVSFPEFTSLIYLICSSILGLAVIFSVILIYGLKNFYNSVKNLKYSIALVCTAVTGIVILFILQKTGVFSDSSTGFSMGIYGKSSGARTVSFLAAVLVFPLIQEFTFRFTFYQILRTKISFIFSGLITSLIFGAIHYGFGSVKLWFGILTGIFFCWLYEKSRNILFPAAVHSISNIVNILFM